MHPLSSSYSDPTYTTWPSMIVLILRLTQHLCACGGRYTLINAKTLMQLLHILFIVTYPSPDRVHCLVLVHFSVGLFHDLKAWIRLLHSTEYKKQKNYRNSTHCHEVCTCTSRLKYALATTPTTNEVLAHLILYSH